MLERTKENVITIETERLNVCDKNEYAESLKAVFTDNKTMQFYPQFISHAKAGFEKFLEILNNSGLYVYPFALKETGSVIGFITLNNADETCKRIEVGYFLLSSCWKKGYAREILDAVVRYLKEHRWHRIEATVYSGNKASERVLQACGFVLEGVLRDKYLIHGKYHDDIIYSIIVED